MFQQIKKEKSRFLPWLLMGDEQESMIQHYLDRGQLFVLYENNAVACVAVVTDEGDGLCELKNMATDPAFRRQGYGRRMIELLCEQYRPLFHSMQVGTGESPLTLPFYEACGFTYSHRIPNFFTDNYDHPIVEEGILLRDMVYLKREL
ncbi:MAG: GNAT family N-acetyltransferase [Oscillospiraceae bacterium]|nr:GNAT family N-acetyltransferase [Oscillospiraceae bacterium]